MVRTRIAPSPTGQDIHIGNLYTAMINYCFAKKNKGQFIIRIEDTDQSRLVKGSEQKILESLSNYGLVADESPKLGGKYAPYRQSERLKLYHQYAQKLIDNGVAYYCTCSQKRLSELRHSQQLQKKPPKYDKHCLNHQAEIKQQIKNKQPYVIRLNVKPNQVIEFNDLVRGKVSINTNDLDDQILLKSDGFPTYHLAVVVDDHLMNVTHVIRAEEWLPSTPKHILLYKAFNWKLPSFAHLPILRNPDRSKLSKRKNPVWASWYLQQGFLPEAVLNYLGLMGFSHPEEKEIFSLKEYERVISLERIQSSGPVFDINKLEWLNGEYLRRMSKEKLQTIVKQYLDKYNQTKLEEAQIKPTIPLTQTRIKKLSDYWPLVEFIFYQPTKIDFSLNYLKQAERELLKTYEQINWTHQNIYKQTEQVAQNLAIKPIKLYMDIRFALSNQRVTAPLFEGMQIIGKNQTISRLKKVLS